MFAEIKYLSNEKAEPYEHVHDNLKRFSEILSWTHV